MTELKTATIPATSKRSAWITYVPALAFVLVMLTGFCVTVISLSKVPAESWKGVGEPKQLFGGESTRRFSAQLNAHFIWSKVFSQIERAVTWTVAGDTGTAVRMGCQDWFFLSDELEVFPDAEKSALARAGIVSNLAKDLKARGIQLVVAVVPDKSRIEQAHLCGLHRPASFASRLDSWVDQLKKTGVDTINLAPALMATSGERYYRTDSHWNEIGSNASAAAIAAHLHAEKLHAAPAVAPDPAALKSKVIDRSGDLLRVANLDGLPAILRPKAETAQLTTIVASASATDSADAAGDDLFGDIGLPTVALVGTSFSRASNFVPFLSYHLGAPVANFAKDGGNFEGAAMAYLSGKTFQQSPPKVVLWEVPERMLPKPLTPSEQKWIAYFSAKKK
ncbi:alginate O-acetyltransferase AlgX-related protein [Undibacterium sp. RuTC16W]|uniref:alginate O-acetyltransferase AlgX-related protein n=1 Tax=Undibacterium sp. RuTC16W TaxID=3413048 RepID=UPI003BF05F58